MDTAGTVLDVVDAYFHGNPSKDVSRLSEREIREFGDEIRRFYENAAFRESPGAVYLGGYHGGWPSLSNPVAHETLKSLLYYESIVIHDPLAEYFREGVPRLPKLKPLRERHKRFSVEILVDGWASSNTIESDHSDLDRMRRNLAANLEFLESMRPAVEAGIILLRAVWPSVEARVHQLESSLRHDLDDQNMQDTLALLLEANDPPLSWDNIRGMSVVPTSGLFPGDERLLGQAPFLYLAKSLAIADSTGSRYAPYQTADFKLFEAKVLQTLDRARGSISGEFIRSVGDVLLPDFDLPVKDLVSIRKNESAFEAWRAQMRTLSRDYGHLAGAELEEAIQDAFIPRVHEVDSAIKAGSLLQRSKSGFSEVVVTAVASTVVAGAVPNPLMAAATATVPAVALWIQKMLRPNSPTSGYEVLTVLRKHKSNRARKQAEF